MVSSIGLEGTPVSTPQTASFPGRLTIFQTGLGTRLLASLISSVHLLASSISTNKLIPPLTCTLQQGGRTGERWDGLGKNRDVVRIVNSSLSSKVASLVRCLLEVGGRVNLARQISNTH